MSRFAGLLFVLAPVLIALGRCPAQAHSAPRNIIADMRDIAGTRDLLWQDCVGADHGPLMLRGANQAQLRMVHRETGFRYVRFHGIFTHTRVYREVGGKAVYDFSE